LVLFQPTRQHIALVSHAVVSTAVVSIVVAPTVVAITVVYARAWRWASVLLRLVLPPSVLLLQVLITAGQAITALPRLSVVHTATTITPPTTAAYRRRNDFNAPDIERAEANAAALSNNLNECALCEATAQKAEHCSRVHGPLAARVRESLVL